MDAAQHTFSSETEPVLFNGLLALERLHQAWSSRKDKAKYTNFKDALEDGLSKIEEYYDKTSTSHAYTMVMGAWPTVSIFLTSLIHLC